MHPHRVLFTIAASVMLLAALAGCSGDSDAPDSQPAATPTNTAIPTPPAALLTLQRQYDDLQTAQVAILSVWEGLASGEQIQCGAYPVYPMPETITSGDSATFEALAIVLRSAAIDVDQAVSLWRAECMNPRATTPPNIIDQGRLAARSAGDSLREAEQLLAP